jgi:hypothetical protein
MAVKGLIGKWAFVAGIVLAIILGIIGTIDTTSALALLIIGLLVGLLNVRSKEATQFLLAGIALLIATNFGQAALGTIVILKNILIAIMAIVIPAVVVVALREVFLVAKK